MRRVLQTTTKILSTAALSMTVLGAAPTRASAQSVAVKITLDADSIELLRAWRRQHGLDPPDAQADERVAALLRHRQAAQDGDSAPARRVHAIESASGARLQRAPPRP
jgi:hypothetical protein